MREIKFRGRKSGYRSDKKEWVFGDYFYDGFHCVHCIREGAHIPPTYDEPGGDYHQEDHEINADTLGQYTGLKDKNGKEIYEGDVIKIKYETSSWGRKIKYNFIGKVVFGSFSTEEREGCSEDIEGWYILAPCEVTNEMTDTYSLADHNHNCEIIGNVHENPELIKL